MIESFINLVSKIVAYLAVKGIDSILGKWVAYFTIAFEKSASKQAIEEYSKTFSGLVDDLASKYDDWKAWKESVKPKPKPIRKGRKNAHIDLRLPETGKR